VRLPPNHPQRYVLSNEIHARPPQEFESPHRLSYVVVMYDTQAIAVSSLDDLIKLSVIWGAPAPTENVTHYEARSANVHLKWERHTEFVTYTFSCADAFDHPFERAVIQQVNEDWLSGLSGTLIVALHVAIEQHRVFVPDLDKVRPNFQQNYLVGAKVAGGNAIALTDFRIHADEFGRILLMDLSLGKRQCGRTVQRLLEIETYRMAALLGLPVAREAARILGAAEQELAMIAALLAEQNGTDEAALLVRLTQLAATVESQVANTSFRFGASRAYYDLTIRRIEELREERLASVQTIEEFLDRRLAPAMATCRSVEKRLIELSERVARASDLLRTRVDIEREQQNQALLASMNRRARMQLRLQQTVEGLSIAAITYYVVALISYAAKALKSFGLPISVDVITAASIPVVAGVIWMAARRMRKRIRLDAAEI
jgi:uncharacterized membrane-anchored protein